MRTRSSAVAPSRRFTDSDTAPRARGCRTGTGADDCGVICVDALIAGTCVGFFGAAFLVCCYWNGQSEGTERCRCHRVCSKNTLSQLDCAKKLGNEDNALKSGPDGIANLAALQHRYTAC